MGNISISASCVIGLYDSLTEFPIRTQRVRLASNGEKEPLYKGNGVFVFMGNIPPVLEIEVMAEGYQDLKRSVDTGKYGGGENRSVQQYIFWLTPDGTDRKIDIQEKVRIPLQERKKDEREYTAFVKSREYMLRLEEPYDAGQALLSIAHKDSQMLTGRTLLIESEKGCVSRTLTAQADGDGHRYRLDAPLTYGLQVEDTRIYKGYSLSTGREEGLFLPLPYKLKDDRDVWLYSLEGEKQKVRRQVLI